MLYVQVNELNKVVMSHMNPMDEVYGMGQTEEELRESGFLFEFLDELPRPAKKEGFIGVTYCDGEKFWFEYEVAGQIELQKLALSLEASRAQEAILKRRISELQLKAFEQDDVVAEAKANIQTIDSKSTEALQANAMLLVKQAELEESQEVVKGTVFKVEEKMPQLENRVHGVETQLGRIDDVDLLAKEVQEKANGIENEVSLVKGTILGIEDGLTNQGSALVAANENIEAAYNAAQEAFVNAQEVKGQVDARLHVTDGKLEEQAGEIVVVKNDVTEQKGKLEMTEMTMSESIMEMMMTQMTLMDQQQQLGAQGQDLLAQAEVMGMTEQMMAESLISMMMTEIELMETKQNLLSTTEQMVTTKKELQDTQEQLTMTQAEMAELIMMMLEGGMVQ